MGMPCGVFRLRKILFKKFWAQGDLVSGDLPEPELFQSFYPILEGKSIIRAFVPQSLPQIGINMRHHQRDLLLRIKCQIHAFWDDAPYKFMVVLRCPFLIGGRRVTVEQVRPAVPLMVKFNPGGVGKFTAVISQDNMDYTGYFGNIKFHILIWKQ